MLSLQIIFIFFEQKTFPSFSLLMELRVGDFLFRAQEKNNIMYIQKGGHTNQLSYRRNHWGCFLFFFNASKSVKKK